MQIRTELQSISKTSFCQYSGHQRVQTSVKWIIQYGYWSVMRETDY